MKWEHLNIEKRKLISNLLSSKTKLCDIGRMLNMDPTSISKEIKRNRIISRIGKQNEPPCKLLERFPYVCNGCQRKYYTCNCTQYKYDSKRAQEKADSKLINSRKGINIDKNKFESINEVIKHGIDNKESIYHIVHSNNLEISVPTIYRWINNKLMSISKMDLPYAITFKKRKKAKEKYNYSNNKIDRSSHTYLDYLEHRRLFPGEFSWQMDFLGSIVTDNKSILTLTIPELHFVLIKIIENPSQEKVLNFFNWIEEAIGIKNFTLVFPSILTDRDPCFINFQDFEYSPFTGEQRTRMFYCDAYKSSQKGNVENMNRQLRKYFPKKTSIDHFTDKQIKEINKIIINTKVASLGGFSPKDAFTKIFGKDILETLFNY